jgi:predicted RNA methylase
MNIYKIIKKISLLHSSNTETPTDFELTKLIIDQLDVDWSNPKLTILDPCCGRGTFLLAVADKLEKAGHKRKHIVEKMLFGVDKSRVQSLIAAKALSMYYPGKLNIETADALTKEWKMKFDVVVGNPPFQSTEDGSKRKKMWVQFAEKAIDMGDYTALVTPTAWQKDNAKYFKDISKKIKSHLVAYGDANSHFTVGEDIGYWVVDKSTTSPVTVIDNNPCSPIYNKMLRKGDRWHYRDFQQPHSDIDKIVFPSSPTDDFVVPIFWTAKQVRYCRSIDVKYSGWKVIVNNSGHFYSADDPDKYSRIDNSMTVGLGAWGIKVKSEKEGKNVLSWVRSKLYRVVVEQMKTGGFNNPFIELESLGAGKLWTDGDIYKHFKLTDDEIKYIESNA